MSRHPLSNPHVLAALSLLFFAASASAELDRGVWFWNNTTLPGVDDPIIVALDPSDVGIAWGTGAGVDLVFDGLPGHLYIVRHGNDPGQLHQEIARLRTTTQVEAEILRVPISSSGPRGFWRVERIADQ